jgi:hypothetical protein
MALFFFLVSWVRLPPAIKIGADEGFELAKATLCLKGHALYTEIWNDQPPLDTVLVTEVLRHVSPSVLGPRLLSVGFAALLLSGVFLAAWRLNGLRVAGVAAGLLLVSPGFLELATSVMQEEPALAPVVLALGVLLGHKSGQRGWTAILAGLLFAVGLQMKFIGALYLPLVGFILWRTETRLDEAKPDRSGRLRGFPIASALFMAGLVFGFLVIGW